MAFLANLPSDLIPIIKTYMNKTRLDWRTCKRHEAALIRGLVFENLMEVRHSEMYQAKPEMLRWTLAGRLFISKSFQVFPLWTMFSYFPQKTPPPPMDDYTRWYLLQYRWLTYVDVPFTSKWVCDV